MSGKLILYCSRSSDLKFKFSDSSDGPVGSDSSNDPDVQLVQNGQKITYQIIQRIRNEPEDA